MTPTSQYSAMEMRALADWFAGGCKTEIMDKAETAAMLRQAADAVEPENAFIFHMTRKDGWTVVTSPQHLGLYVAHKDEDLALGDAARSLRKLLELDGPTP